MSIVALLGATLSLYGLLNFIAIPQLTNAWKQSRSLTKIGRAGLLGGLQFARDLCLTASITYIAFAVVTLTLGVGFGSNITWLRWATTSASTLHVYLKSIKGVSESWFFLIPLVLIIVITWRRQRDEWLDKFEGAVEDEYDRLNEARQQNPESWSHLEADAAMLEIDEQIRAAEAEVSKLAAEGAKDPRKRQEILKRIVKLREQKGERDYQRRISFEKVDNVFADRRPQSAWLKFLVSRGLFSDLKGLTKLLSRATLSMLLITLVGVSTAGLGTALEEGIVHLDDLRVETVKKNVNDRWEAAAQQPPAQALTDDDKRAVRILTDEFARALVRNPQWQLPRIPMTAQQESTLARRAILGQIKLPNEQGAPVSAFQDGLSSIEKEILEDAVNPRSEMHLGDVVAQREGPRIKSWFGSKWEKTKETILQHASQYQEPVQMKDLQESLLDRVITASFDGVTPEFGDGEVMAQVRKTLNAVTKKAVNEAVTTQFHNVLEDLADGKSYQETIEKVRTADVPISKSKGQELLAILHDGAMPNERRWKEFVDSEPGSWNPPPPGGTGGPGPAGRPPGTGGGGSPAVDVDDILGDVVRRNTDNGRYSLIEEAVDGLAEYEDYFPRSVASQGETVLGRTLAKHRLPAQIPAFSKIASLKVARASSFSMLRGFSRIGGVLIGEVPQNPNERADIRDLSWRIDGRNVWLTLKGAAARVDEFGPFDKSLVHQALAYATDGRPVAVTMTKARPLPQLKIHLHPALLDTPLGCRVIELDRLVDTYAGTQLPKRQDISINYATQGAVYNFAWALRLSVLAEKLGTVGKDWLETADVQARRSRQMAAAGLTQPSLFQPQSILAKKPEFFDPSLIEGMKACRTNSVAEFERCLISRYTMDPALLFKAQGTLKTWLNGPTTFDPWSGVRERKYRVGNDLAFLRPPGTSTDDQLWPFDFIVQLAFTSAPVSLDGERAESYVDETPVEFGEPIAAEALDFGQRRRRCIEQRPDVDALALRCKRREVGRAAREHVDGPVMIQPPEMKERDPDLQDALIEPPHLAALGAPEELERFVLLEELAAIELRDAFEQRRRGRFCAAHAVN